MDLYGTSNQGANFKKLVNECIEHKNFKIYDSWVSYQLCVIITGKFEPMCSSQLNSGRATNRIVITR